MKKPKPSVLFLFYEREHRNYIRKIRKKDYKYKKNKITPLYKGKSQALELMKARCPHIYNNNFFSKYNGRRDGDGKKHNIVIPETFSIIEDPKLALKTIYEFVYTIKNYAPRMLHYNHGKLVKYDLGAESILDYISEEYKRECSAAKKKLRIMGEIRANHQLYRFMKGIGIVSSLGKKNDSLKESDLDSIKIFKKDGLRYDFKAEAYVATHQEITTAEFVNHINGCLAKTGKCLTHNARHALGAYLGEILDNIDQHAKCNQWRILGYLDMVGDSGDCEIVIFNYGLSFAESMKAAPEGSLAKNNLDEFINNYKNNFPEYVAKNESSLITIYALQECVSALNYDVNDDRGMGTMEFIDFFQKIHDACSSSCKSAKMVLISGDVYILFDGTYRIQMNGNGKRQIAFNEYGDISKPFNDDYVKLLSPYFFPGTIISIKFPLYRNLTEGMNNANDSSH